MNPFPQTRKLIFLALCLAVAMASGAANAQLLKLNEPVQGPVRANSGPDAPETHAAALQAKLEAMYPNRQFGMVVPTPIPGLFEVGTGDKLSYVDSSGTYFLFDGQLVDFKQQVNLTERRLNDINRIDASKLPLGDAMKLVKGNGQRVLIVFTDPNCPYCKKLESDLQEVDNVTIYSFLFPILQGSKEKAAHVWCSTDRLKAWDDLMQRGAQPLPSSCDNPVDRNLALGQSLRVSGTPTMFAADGRRLVGAVGAAALNSFLDTAKVAGK